MRFRKIIHELGMLWAFNECSSYHYCYCFYCSAINAFSEKFYLKNSCWSTAWRNLPRIIKCRQGLPWWLSGKESTCQCRRRVWSLVWEDPTCCKTTKTTHEPICYKCWSSCAPEPVLPNKRSPHGQWEAHQPQWRVVPTHHN